MHVGLLFDTSASMTDDIKLSRSAAVKFLNTLSDAKDMTLVDFDTEVR
ncbi:MAG: VWA domain-containing protein, partial [Acidobacteria bacterium]